MKVDAKPREGIDPEVFILRERLLKLEALLEEVRGERDRLWAELERRRWPGLWPALRRLIYGIENP